MVPTSPPQSASPVAVAAAAELRAVTLAFDRYVILSRLSLTVPAGGLSVIVGPAGAGKTTVLRCLLGRHIARSGEVRVLGRSPTEARAVVGFVPPADQQDWGFPLSVEEVVLLGSGRGGLVRRGKAGDWAGARRSLERVGLAGLADRRVGELSAGERHRCLIARALLRAPELLLIDEPWPAPDAEDGELFALLGGLRDEGVPVLVATRDLTRAREPFDRVILLNGEVVAEGSPGEVLTAANLRDAYGSAPVTVRLPAERLAADA